MVAAIERFLPPLYKGHTFIPEIIGGCLREVAKFRGTYYTGVRDDIVCVIVCVS